jgi:RHS repeat-associated protein
VTSILQPSGVAEAMTWTDTGQLLSRTARLGTQVLASSDYTYGNGFLRTSMTDLTGTSSYTYDAMSRLVSATHPASSGLSAESFSYDQTNNRTSWVGSPASSVSYTAGRLTRDGTYDYVYDNEGNLTRRTERATSRVTTYDWNADHLLTAIHYPDGTTSTYRYDPLGRRIEVNDAGAITRYVWDGNNVVAEYDGSNTLERSYVTTGAPGQVLAARTGAQWQSYLVDGTGSVVATVNDAGAVTSRETYDTYGRPANPPADSTYTFTGHQYDSKSGLYYARARYYDPAVGRFISEDPIPSLNAYQYSSCNPTNLVDSSGMQVAVERSLLDRIREGISEVALQELSSYICQELVKAAILGFGGGPNALGQAGEQALGEALGPDAIPQQDLGARRPDFQVGSDFFEAKNAAEINGRGYRQLRDTAALVTEDGGRYFVLTRASTAESILKGAGRLSRFFGSTPGVFLIGCLPG